MTTKQLSQIEFFKLLEEKTVFLYYEYEDVCFRVFLNKSKNVDSFTKFRGETEFATKRQSQIFGVALDDPYEILKTDYDNF